MELREVDKIHLNAGHGRVGFKKEFVCKGK